MHRRFVLMIVTVLASAAPQNSIGQEAPSGGVPKLEDTIADDKRLAGEADRLLDRGHFDEAIRIYSDLLERYPEAGMVWANRAMAYLMTNRLDEGRSDLAAAEANIPEHAMLDRIRGVLAMRLSDDQAALTHLSRSLEKEPGNPFALRMRAYINQRAGNEKVAIDDAEAFIKAKPHDPDAYVLKASLLIGQEKREQALAEADRLLIHFANDAYGIAAAGRIYDDLGNRDRALAAIDRAIALDPKLFYYRKLRAKFRRWDDFAGRRDDLNAALEADPGNASILAELGFLEFRQHRWREAADRFSEVLALEPKDFGLLAYRAMAQLQAGNGQAAVKDFKAAIASSSGADDYDLVCRSFGREGLTLAWALEACDRAVKLKDKDSRFRANRGLVKMRLGQLEESLADYHIAIESDQRRADGYYGRALVYHRLNTPLAAKQDLQKALEIDPNIVEEYEQYGFEKPISLDSAADGRARQSR